MATVSYITAGENEIYGYWTGTSKRTENGPRKQGRIYLGKVINKQKHLFWNRQRGYFVFDPETQEYTEPGEDLLPECIGMNDHRRLAAPVIVDFGDSYFLDQYIRGIGYDAVINALGYDNNDTLYALLYWYILDYEANGNAEEWYQQNYVRYLFPKADLTGQGIREMLMHIGRQEQKREFLKEHISYLLGSGKEGAGVLIDSTGMSDQCDFGYTCPGIYNGRSGMELPMIAVIQKTTGLPLYYEVIDADRTDAATNDRVIEICREYGCSVEYRITDAGYSSTQTLERLLSSGLGFMIRLSPYNKLVLNALEEHYAELDSPESTVLYNQLSFHVIKIPTVIAQDPENGREIAGFLYVCRDEEFRRSKAKRLMNTRGLKESGTDGSFGEEEKFETIVILTTRDLSINEVLPEYYVRLKIKSYFDYGKNYERYLPESDEEALNGHLLLSFIAAFIISALKNRLDSLDAKYVSIPNIFKKEELAEIEWKRRIIELPAEKDDEVNLYLRQNKYPEISGDSVTTLLATLRGQKADVFETKLTPTVAGKRCNDIYSAFNVARPQSVLRNGVPLPQDKQMPDDVEKALIFAGKPSYSEKALDQFYNFLRRGRPKKQKTIPSDAADSETASDRDSASQTQKPAGKKRGRPSGRKDTRQRIRRTFEEIRKSEGK